ncbi:MAG: hypothetical protein NTZ25_00170 [Candidatus Peregrinibacteria bacterium]|nr:hypothetical protein [Candidatus Peregrinibacteria bacterium]
MSPEVSTEQDVASTLAQPVNPAMAPEFAMLREAGYPLDALKLPNVRLEGGNVVFSTMTTDSTNSPEYRRAFESLQAQGCEVNVDPNGAENFVGVQILAPEALLPAEVVAGIGESIAARAEAARRTGPSKPFDAGEIGVGC